MLELINVHKKYKSKHQSIHALNQINLKIEQGDIYGIIGKSGAGKSTLVRCINLLERPSSGKVLFQGLDLVTISEKELREQRSKIGMIFQHFHLMEQKTVFSNICFPLEILGVPSKVIHEKASKMLGIVGLSDKALSYPSELSGGQKQRVAIARALINNPKILLCDEATSALDPETRNSILTLLKSINKDLGITVIVITHEMGIVEALCNKVAVLDQGHLVETGTVEQIFSHAKSSITRKLIEERHIPISIERKQIGA